MDKLWDSGQEPLTIEDCIMCLERRINSQEDMDKFKLYWQDYLPKHIGASFWSPNANMLYVTISAAVRTDCSRQLPLITPEDEAFLVLCIHNQRDRWKNESVIKKNGGKVDKKESHNGLFTSTRSGQNRYGGWNEDGLNMFKTYLDKNIAARKTQKGMQVEKDCLQQLRAKYNITTNTYEEHQKLQARIKSAKKRGNTNEPAPRMQAVVNTLRHEYDESEDEEDDD
jgi:hypothetical protein